MNYLIMKYTKIVKSDLVEHEWIDRRYLHHIRGKSPQKPLSIVEYTYSSRKPPFFKFGIVSVSLRPVTIIGRFSEVVFSDFRLSSGTTATKSRKNLTFLRISSQICHF